MEERSIRLFYDGLMKNPAFCDGLMNNPAFYDGLMKNRLFIKMLQFRPT